MAQKRVQYRRIVNRRGRRPSWLKLGDILHKLEHYNCFIIQTIDNKSQLRKNNQDIQPFIK